MPEELKQFNVLRPAQEMMEYTPVTRVEEPTTIFMVDHVECPKEGGIYLYYRGCPYPKKGLPFPEAVYSINLVKRIVLLIAQSIAPYKLLRIKWLEPILYTFIRESQQILNNCLLKDSFYCTSAKEFRKLFNIFVQEIGIREDISLELSKAMATLLEYDNAYRYRFQDLMSETTKEKMLKQPIREFKKLIQLAKERDMNVVAGKTTTLLKLLTLSLLIPKIRKAFKKAIKGIDFEKLQLDEADRYFCLNRSDYRFFGEEFEVRMQKYNDIHNGILPEQYEINFQKT